MLMTIHIFEGMPSLISVWPRIVGPDYALMFNAQKHEIIKGCPIVIHAWPTTDRAQWPMENPVLWLFERFEEAVPADGHPFDDIVRVPLQPVVLAGRVRSWLQGWYRAQNPVILQMSRDIRLNLSEKKLVCGARTCALTDKECEILQVFLQERRLWTRAELLTRIWNFHDSVETHTLASHIHRLRKKIQDIGGDPGLIETHDDGYSLKQ